MSKDISRRAVVATAALVPLSTLRTAAATADTVFSEAQRRTLEVFIDRLVPEDENGPSASQCGAAKYIDASLADFLSAEKPSFLEGLNAMDAYSRRAHDAPFADLPPDKQDAVLAAVDGNRAEGFANSRAFFERVRRLTLEGMMSDPHYGGNVNYGGWDLIRYPGPRLAAGEEEQKISGAIKPVRASAYGHGH